MDLNSAFRHAPIRTRHDGLLLESGYRWDEWRLRRYLEVAALSLAAIVVGPVLIWPRDPPIGLGALAMGLLIGAIVVCRLWWPRVVLFLRDGSILTPHGITWRFWVRKLDIPHTEVTSIELTSGRHDWGVVILTIEGRSVLVCESMHKDDARLIAVQLSKALREMRESLATVASRQQAKPAALAPVWVH